MKLIQDLIFSFGPILLLLLVWFAPIALVYKVAKEARKNTSYVLLGGLLLGWVGAAVVALILPRQSDEEFAAMHAPRVRAKDTGSIGITTIVLTTLGFCLLVLVGFLFFVSQM